ncbi:MAG TPA: TetR family transcriptional regulator [Candidatus Binataceae bacterium]|jgi:AcrR family transcriptional regulator|nr:TetR family transcriptional regulator [Candidatus Binataceae bacterium]
MISQRSLTRASTRLERLLDEAEQLFVREGFLHLSTAELAARLRCSKRALYAIAPCAEKFFAAVITRRTRRLAEELVAQIEAAPDVDTALVTCLDSIAAILEQDSPVFLRDLTQFSPGVQARKDFQQQLADALVRLIERGERQHVFRRIEPRVAAEALLVSVGRMVESDFLAHSPITAAEAIRQLYQVFACGLRSSRNGTRTAARAPARKRLERVVHPALV